MKQVLKFLVTLCKSNKNETILQTKANTYWVLIIYQALILGTDLGPWD